MTKLKFDYIPIDKIDVSSLNVRKVNLEERLEELAISIKTIDVQQPIMVFKKPDGRYELIIGQRRYLACKKIGKKTIPAVITDVKDKNDALIISFSENIHRLDLAYQDKMTMALELLKILPSIENVAKFIGVHPQTVKDWLGYASVPEPIKEMVKEGKFGSKTALRIVRDIPDEKQAIKIAKLVEEEPRKEDQRDIIDVGKENPDEEPKEIKKIHEKRKKEKRPLTVNLTEKISKALNEACKRYNSKKDDIALEALEEWLTKRGFIE